MPLSMTQIRFLRAALEAPLMSEPWPDAGIVPRSGLPVAGAAARAVINTLLQRGLINAHGAITLQGRGALLRDPQATSEAV